MAKQKIGWFATREEANAEIRRMISAGKGAAVMRVEERPSRPDSAAVAAGIVPASGTPVYYIVVSHR